MNQRFDATPGTRFQTMSIQKEGGTGATIEAVLTELQNMLLDANAVKRSKVLVSELTVPLQCGGSEGYSGITALGVAVDLLVQLGGTAALRETPEVFGVENLLTCRVQCK
ncbi:MAG: altronate hydrolase [Porticoccaceae bacterium]|jgi:altronate hydrolase